MYMHDCGITLNDYCDLSNVNLHLNKIVLGFNMADYSAVNLEYHFLQNSSDSTSIIWSTFKKRHILATSSINGIKYLHDAEGSVIDCKWLPKQYIWRI